MKNTTQKKYLLAVSGGVDSMVMLHMFLNAMPTQNFAVVSVNHNLRAEGAFDCNFVKQYCKENDVVFFAKHVNVRDYALDKKLSIETAARQLRYKAIQDVADTYGYDEICLAHHAEDNAETVLLHLVRGGGLRGVGGIRRHNGKFFRPLLNLSKQEILRYAEDNGIPYVIDKTNDDTIYKRNLVRHEVLPALKQINPNAVQAINAFASLSQQEDDFLDSLADLSFVQFADQTATVPLKEFNELHHVLKSRVLRKTMRALGYFKDVEIRHVNALINLAKQSNGQSQIDLPFGLIARRSYDTLCICPKPTRQSETPVLPFAKGVFSFDKFFVGIHDSAPIDSHYLMLDADKVPKNAVIRSRKQGDRFAKFGSGEKKLKDYLIDEKIPQYLRDALPLLAYDDTIYAVFGKEISREVKVTQDTKNVLYLTLFEE